MQVFLDICSFFSLVWPHLLVEALLTADDKDILHSFKRRRYVGKSDAHFKLGNNVCSLLTESNDLCFESSVVYIVIMKVFNKKEKTCLG